MSKNQIQIFNEFHFKQYGVGPKFCSKFRGGTKIFDAIKDAIKENDNKLEGLFYLCYVNIDGKDYCKESHKNIKDARFLLCKALNEITHLKKELPPKKEYDISKSGKEKIVVWISNFMDNIKKIKEHIKCENVSNSKILSAFLHKSIIKLFPEIKSFLLKNYEIKEFCDMKKTEFIGDIILKLVVSEHYSKLDEYYENNVFKIGMINQKIQNLTSNKNLKRITEKLDIFQHVLFYIGNFDKNKTKIYADITESIIGLIYEENGIDKAKEFVLENIILTQ